MRRAPAFAPPLIQPDLTRRQTSKASTALVFEIRNYELITPLFGGGVTPGEADPVTVIRGASIRGHLRFWWRACRGGQFNGVLRNLKDAEAKMWGAASTSDYARPSQIQIMVDQTHDGKDDEPFQGKSPRPTWRNLGYVAFPLQPNDERPHSGKVREGVRFRLQLSFPECLREDIEAALWCWETFGGIGGRTRRGFGAIRRTDVPGIASSSVRLSLEQQLGKCVPVGVWPHGVPHLTHDCRFKVTDLKRDARAAWEHLVNALKAFRQKRNPGTQGRPGRSMWPEPDEIRRLTGRSASAHANPISSVHKFPRGEFGLPIIFHFKDEGQGDPRDTTLQGRDYDRLASPIILRPLACADGHAVGLALILEGTQLPPGGLILKGGRGDRPVDSKLNATEASTVTHLNGQTDVIAAFLNAL